MNANRRKTGLMGILLCAVCFTGCGDDVSRRIAIVTKPRIKKWAVMYKMYSNAHQFKGPSNANELKSWALGNEKVAAQLGKFGIDVYDFDSFMVSDRTGDEFEFRWGLQKGPMSPPYPVVFEPNAFEGHRQVGMAGGRTLLVYDNDLYDKLKQGEYNPDDFEQVTRGTNRAPRE